MYDEENQIARDPLSSRVRGDVHELRKSQFKNCKLPNNRGVKKTVFFVGTNTFKNKRTIGVFM